MSVFRISASGMSAVLALLATMPALAHDPGQSNLRVAQCWAEDEEVVCRSTRAVTGSWNHVPVQVFGAAGEELLRTRTDGKGLARFGRPATAFHVLIGDKPGEAVEVHWRDVEAETARRQGAR